MRRQSRALIESTRRCASRAVLVVAALAILLAMVRGGGRFFYCPTTHLAFDVSPCCADADENPSVASDDGEGSQAPALRTAGCCLEKWRAAAPTASSTSPASVSVAPAELVSVQAHSSFELAMSSAKAPFGVSRTVRAGPPAPPAGKRRAQLMVFHI
jgi:hypothetical protein